MPRLAALLILAAGYWEVVARLADVVEPWDAAAYWQLAYPVSLLLAAAGGAWLGRRGWLAGAAVIFAQAPVMAAAGTPGPLWGAGVLLLAILAIPAVALAGIGGLVETRRRSR